MQKFHTTQTNLVHLNGQKVLQKEPLSESEYDRSEVGSMWVIHLESGVSLHCFDDELIN